MPGRIWIDKTLYESGFRSRGGREEILCDPSEWIIAVQPFDGAGI
jgi:hypothetical protein